jgi:integrase
MTSKFDPKIYAGKARVYLPVPGAQGILKVWRWLADKGEYAAPIRGGRYVARRWEGKPGGGRSRTTAYFETLDEARAWRSNHSPDSTVDLLPTTMGSFGISPAKELGPTLSEVLVEFRKRHYPKLARGSVVNYEQQFGLHFGALLALRVNDVTPSVVDNWLDGLKAARDLSYRPVLRKSFEKELALLATLLRFYDEYWDDKAFKLPIKKRHRENAQVVRNVGKKERTLSYSDFLTVREAALNTKYGTTIFTLMTVQFRQALRIGEVAALHWEDVVMDFREPSRSVIRVCRHVDWARKRADHSMIVDGLKNSAAAGLSKELPMFPETFEALKRIFVVGGRGLVFKNDRETFFEYRSLQHAYETAFKRAGLPYGGTHNFRHGGCQLVYDRTGGDQALAGQLLGNEDSDTVKVYARRSKTALREAAQREWDAM